MNDELRALVEKWRADAAAFRASAEYWREAGDTEKEQYMLEAAYDKDAVADELQAALDAQSGMVLVPRVPTEAMGLAYLEGAKLHAANGRENVMRFSPGGYTAMLAAAQAGPVEGGKE